MITSPTKTQLRQLKKKKVTMGKRSKKNSTNNSIDDNDIPATCNDSDSAVAIVLPGDSVASHIDIYRTNESDEDSMRTTTKTAIRNKLGKGLRVDSHSNQVYATFSGRLVHKYCKDNDGARVHTYYVEPHRTGSSNNNDDINPPYTIESLGLSLIGSATTDEGGGDLYRIDINAAHYGILSNLQFAGATKRNKPILQSGQIVYCRVLNDATTTTIATAAADTTTADTDDETSVILSCMNGPYDVGIPSKDWTTKENCYGELRNGGTLCRVSMPLARNLLISSTILSHDSKKDVHNTIEQHNVILEELAKHSQEDTI